jgi:hypothetical protein
MKPGVYITVDHFGKAPVTSRPLCQGCTPPSVDGRSEPAISPERAEYQVVGVSGTIALCRNCSIHAIKSLAARFVLFDPSATRDLMSFFSVEAGKRRPDRKKSSLGKRRSPTKRVIDVEPLLLEGKKKA